MNDYVVLVEQGESGWGAWSPDLDVYATAPTREAVEDQVREAIAFHLEGLRAIKAEPPKPALSAITVRS